MKTYEKTGAALLCTGGASCVWAENIFGTADNGWHTIIDSDYTGNVYGNNDSPNLDNVVTGHLEMTGGTVDGAVYGGSSDDNDVSGSTVEISGGEVSRPVYGGYSYGGNASGNTVKISDGTVDSFVDGGYSQGNENRSIIVTGNTVEISGNGTVALAVCGGDGGDRGVVTGNTVKISDNGTVKGNVYGGRSQFNNVTENRVIISGGTVNGNVYGGSSDGSGNAIRNMVTISGCIVESEVYGGFSSGGIASDNTVTLSGAADVAGAQLYGSNTVKAENSGNKLVVDNWSGAVDGLHNFESIHFTNIEANGETVLDVADGDNISGMDGVKIFIDSLAAGDYASDPKNPLIATVKWDERLGTDVTIADDLTHSTGGWVYTDREDGGLYVNQFDVKHCDIDTNQVDIFATVENSALTGKFIDENGAVHYRTGDTEESHPLVIGDGFTTNVDTVAGAYALSAQSAAGGQVLVTGNVDFDGAIYGGYVHCGSNVDSYGYGGDATGNTVTLKGAAADNLTLYGGGVDISSRGKVFGNTLVVAGGTENTVKSVQNFDTIRFQNLNWQNGGVALKIVGAGKDNELANTSVQVENLVLANEATVQVGDRMTFIQSNKDTGLSVNNVSVTEDASFSQGVATVGQLSVGLEGATHNLVGEITEKSLNPQTLTIAENRTAAAAFLNQGADIVADSLDLLGSDYKYGLRTFGAVYGSRSTYDAAGDLKINGWSEIVGLGNVHRKGDGDLSWGVFYENGTGNYRTWNEFNNEMFRGDGSLLYNGGGAAVRYKQDNGWYYEASLRAGTLSASMDNAVKDGKGNSYGFDSDSTYWGAHAGVGKVIETERGEWNVYGKYFHTDIDGDSFTIDGDRFEFDSLTSDRLRIGTRYTADKAKRWSLYYGLAWEYEFTGDSHMRAAGMNAPEQSLGGSTGVAEIGTVWQPDDSPWQANINLKGYAGEREGVSGMVQLAYTF